MTNQTVMALQVTQLRCEDRAVAVGVDVPHPRLGWALYSKARAQRQTAYQILVASSEALLQKDNGDLWDTHEVPSSDSLGISYAGLTLKTGQRVFWKVRAWDQNHQSTAWSMTASWTMGIVDPFDWSAAQWITAAAPTEGGLLLRHEFNVRSGLCRAVVFVSGVGQYVLTINGKSVTTDRLTPGWTKYDKTVLYDTYDVDALLHAGGNAAGISLGNGMYDVPNVAGRYAKFHHISGPKAAIARLYLQYADGTTENITTDTRWRATAGPITFLSIYGGEDNDARLNPKGWDLPGFDDDHWIPAVTTTGPGGALGGLSRAAPPVRAIETLTPIAEWSLRPGVTVYDFGQNASQVPTITVHGPRGSSVRLTPAELLNGDGTVNQQSTGTPIFCTYTLAGDGQETWSPHFFYSGYRYLQLEMLPASGENTQPAISAVQSTVLHTSSPPIGTFETSDPLLNRIYTLVRWAQRSNMVSVLTDCPHREKLGWLEQIHLNGPALRYNFDLNAFFAKTMNDMADSQLADGMIPTTAPEYPVFGGNFRDSPEWGSAAIIVPWQQYQFTGDASLLRRYYEVMQRYVAYLDSRAKDHIVAYGLSDWYDIGPGAPGESKLTPRGVTATAFYYADTVVLSKTAALLQKTEDAAHYRRQADDIRMAFNRHFFNLSTHQYASGSQCANAMPLVMGLTSESARDAVLKQIVEDVTQKQLTAGDIGYRFLLKALADAGRSDIIFAMIDQTQTPGYGMQLARGATSLTEAWDANPKSSQNHFMLGQINEWFFGDLAGIQPDPAGPGFARILIRPAIIGDVTHVRATYDSVRGPITSEWTRTGGHLTLKIDIPANTAATVTLPARDPATVTESGINAAVAVGVFCIAKNSGQTVYAVESGQYRFDTELP